MAHKFQVSSHLTAVYSSQHQSEGTPSRGTLSIPSGSGSTGTKVRRSEVTRVQEAVKAIALCHNVTPVCEDDSQSIDSPGSMESQTEADQHYWHHEPRSCVYQASSPDEVHFYIVYY